MPATGPEITPLMLPRIGAAVCGTALLFPALALPLALACLVVLGKRALEESRAANVVPEVSPAEPYDRAGQSVGGADDSTEDSFPASDPPSWTPVTGTGTRP